MNTVLITGGSRGIGAAAVRVFSSAGYRVAFTYFHSVEAAQAVARETGAIALAADVSDCGQVEAAAQAALAALRHIDVLVNNAGVSDSRLFTDITPDDWRRVMGVNLDGVFYMARAVLPGMISRKQGCIINLSSVWGLTGASCEVHYSASKAAVIGLTRALAKEVGPSGIRVNCVAPGVIDTDMNAALDEASRAELCAQTPLNRFGTAREIADLILYLASDAASFITGQVISPNGGFYI